MQMRFTDSLTVFLFILNSVYCTFRRFPHRLTFSAFKTLTWFISFTPFFDQIRTTELFVWLSYPMLLTDFLSFLVVLIPDKPSTFVLLLCILQDFSCLDLVYVLPESKICFFVYKYIKLFVAFMYAVICNLPLHK